MINRLLELDGDRLVMLWHQAEEIGSEIEIEITLPPGASMQQLVLKETVVNCQLIENNEEPFYILEIHLSNLSEIDRLVLQAYVRYLEQEKKLDEIFSNLDFLKLVNDLFQNGKSHFDDKAVQEYLIAKLQEITFH